MRPAAEVSIMARLVEHLERLQEQGAAAHVTAEDLLQSLLVWARESLGVEQQHDQAARAVVQHARGRTRKLALNYVYLPKRPARPGAYSSYHWLRPDGGTRAACGVTSLYVEEPFDPAFIEPFLRCHRIGCVHRWAQWVERTGAPS